MFRRIEDVDVIVLLLDLGLELELAPVSGRRLVCEEALQQSDFDLIGFFTLGNEQRISEPNLDLDARRRKLKQRVVERALAGFFRVLNEDHLQDVVNGGLVVVQLLPRQRSFPFVIPQRRPSLRHYSLWRFKPDP